MKLFGFGSDNFEAVMASVSSPSSSRHDNPLHAAVQGYQEQRKAFSIQLMKAIDEKDETKISHLNSTIAIIDGHINTIVEHCNERQGVRSRASDYEETAGRR
jgi:hypothetical protein